jgi:1-acyl-sn-glycerol-3-phosphate acyltransferase
MRDKAQELGRLSMAFRTCAAKLTYWFLELVCWVLWWRNHGKVCGALPDEACVLVSNHGSYLDWLLLDVLVIRKHERNPTFLAKAKLLSNPIWRQMIWYRRAILLDEREKVHATSSVIRLLKKERNQKPVVVVFPEGTRSRTGERLPASAGAAWLARKCGVPLVPVALKGFWQVWPPHKRLPSLKRAELLVEFLEPIDPEALADDEATTRLAMDRIYGIVKGPKALPELLRESTGTV